MPARAARASASQSREPSVSVSSVGEGDRGTYLAGGDDVAYAVAGVVDVLFFGRRALWLGRELVVVDLVHHRVDERVGVLSEGSLCIRAGLPQPLVSYSVLVVVENPVCVGPLSTMTSHITLPSSVLSELNGAIAVKVSLNEYLIFAEKYVLTLNLARST